MKAIIHIGAPKVGSSSIQVLLAKNALALSKLGFAYKQNIKGRGSQFEYPIAALSRMGIHLPGDDNRLRYKCRTLEEQRKNSIPYAEGLVELPRRFPDHVALFSSEHALPWLTTTENIEEFHKMFLEVFSDVTYLAYFRAPEDLIASQYSEHIKTGHTKPFGDFFQSKLNSVSTYRRIGKWLDVVGAERLNVRLLNRNWLEGGDLVTDFCHACGIDGSGLQRPPRLNESLTASGAECLRALNRTIPQLLSDGTRNPLHANLIRAVSQRSSDGQKISLNAGQQRTLRKRMGPDLDWFTNTFFPHDKALFEPPNANNTPTPVEVRDMALDIMAELYADSRMAKMDDLTKAQRDRSIYRQGVGRS
ncbi:hypothetical protein [Ruegeria jejuensis]|uniref:hypothetical protein n=1 Tax=Ruegeria jejuensis TaxID=3233338 RepID=UPI00355B65BD